MKRNISHLNLAPFLGLAIALIAVVPFFFYNTSAAYKTYAALCVLYLLWRCFQEVMIYKEKQQRHPK